MNILLISGSPRKNGNTNALLEELTAGILEAGKHSVKTVDVTRMKIAPCLGCDHCRKNGGRCVHGDGMEEILPAHYQRVSALMGRLTESEQEELIRLLGKLTG